MTRVRQFKSYIAVEALDSPYLRTVTRQTLNTDDLMQKNTYFPVIWTRGMLVEDIWPKHDLATPKTAK